MSLTLTGRTLAGVESENSVLAATPGESIILVLESNEVFLGEITWHVDGAVRAPASTIVNASGEVMAAFPFDGGSHRFEATARVDDEDEPLASNGLLVVGAATSESVAEISIGRFDESFATRSGWIMAALAALVVVVLLLVSLLTLLPSDDGGSWLERVRAVVVIGLASAGVIVLLAGVWMTILEMRGRLRSTVQISAPPADDHGRAAEGGSPQVDVGSVVGGMRDSLASTARESRGARGTVSTIVTGVVLLLLALLGASSLDIQVSTGGPEPAGSPSPVIETPVAPEAPQG